MFKFSNNMKIALLIFFVIIIISFNFNSVVEGLITLTKTSDSSLYTQCRDASSSCSACINAQIQNTSSLCYWNSTPIPGSPKCSAFKDDGYSRNCDTPTPAPNNGCMKFTGKWECILNGCSWNSSTGKCEAKTPTNVCASNTSKALCIQNGCTWNNSTGKCDTQVDPDPDCNQYTLLQSPVYVKAPN